MFKELRRRSTAGLMAFAIVLSNVLLPVIPVLAEGQGQGGNPPGNNGTLQVHEKGTPEMQPSNQPHVCVFNFEAFGLDANQTGTITITAQAPTAAITPVVVPLTTDENGNGSTSPYINDMASPYTLADGHYMATLENKFGTDNGNKAKSKVFWVNCGQTAPTTLPVPVGYTAICGRANDEITLTGDNFSVSADTGWVQDGDSSVKTTRTVTYAADAGFVFAASEGWVLSEDNTKAIYTYTDWGDKCPMTITPCEVITGPTVITSKTQFADSNDDRSAGHYEFTTDGLHIWTDDASSNAKIAWYHNVNYALSEVGAPVMDYTAASGIKPGLQLVVDFDGNGTSDGILIGEEVYSGDWWLNNAAAQFVKDDAPSHTGGFGSDNHGTLNQWLTNFPDAQVKAIGFSLGSGVLANGVLHSLTIGCHEYTFTAPAMSVTPENPKVTDLCGRSNDSYVLPMTAHIKYMAKKNGNKVTVTATPDKDYTLDLSNTQGWTLNQDGTASYAFSFTNVKCEKVTICHRTNSVTNPYVKITVDVNAADGIAGNNGHKADHYGEHQGPVATSKEVAQALKDEHKKWGDIIPPVVPDSTIPGANTEGLNWTAEGRAIYDNGCKYVIKDTPVTAVAPTPIDVCYTDQDYIAVPSTTGVTYYNGENVIEEGIQYTGQNITITAVANKGYVIAEGAQTSWTFTAEDFTDEQCLIIAKTAKFATDTNKDGKIGVGDTITWEITVTNTSKEKYEDFNVVVTDEGATFDLENDGHIDYLGGGDSKILTATSIITLAQMQVCKVSNTASFTAERPREYADFSNLRTNVMAENEDEQAPLASGSTTAYYALDCTPGKGGNTPETPKKPEVLPYTAGSMTQVLTLGALSAAGIILLAGASIKSRFLS